MPLQCPRAACLAAAAIALLLLGLHRYRTLAAYAFQLRSPLANLLANGRAVPEMLSLWLRPWALSVDHPFDAHGSLALGLAGLVFLGGLGALAWALRRQAPLASFAIAWTLIALAPTNSLIPKLDLVTE